MERLRDAWPVIVIVATIAAAAWMAAWNVQGFIAAQIAASEARLTAQIAETRAQIAETRAQITETRAETRAQTAEIRAQIAEIRRYIVDHLDDHGAVD